MFQEDLPLRGGCPSLSWSSEQREGSQAPRQEGERVRSGDRQEVRLLYPGWSLEVKVAVVPFPPLGRGAYSCPTVE